MGVSVSKYSDITSNELLVRFCSTEVICPNDPFWNQMLAFNINPPKSTDEQLMFDSSAEMLLQQFLQNNLQTGNLGSLVQVFITRATELLAAPDTDNAMMAWHTFNALFVIRAVSKYLVEIVPEYELCRHMDVQVERRHNGTAEGTPPAPLSSSAPTQQSSQDVTPQPTPTSPKINGTESRVEMLIDALIGLIIEVPVTENTYYLHLECINTLLVLMSVFMFAGVHGQTNTVDTSLIFRTLFHGRYTMHAPLLVKALLNNWCRMTCAPKHMFGANTGGGSLLISLASTMWSVLTLSKANETIYDTPPLDRHELLSRLRTEHPVANQSCLLLLALTNHCISDHALYRAALLSCEDSAASETSATTPHRDTNNTGTVTPPRIDMAALHKALCATAGCEHSTLLLYLMLHSCKAYKKFVSNDPHIENLIVPILQVLYNAPDSNSHHMYMSLIVLLILTEDDVLIKSVHSIMLKSIPWYTERSISEISVGGLMVLVVVRALQFNLARVRDKYLHTNCLAAIANMSCEFRSLHPYVAQRLISLYETLSKRRARLCNEIEGGDLNNLDLPHHAEEKTEEIWKKTGYQASVYITVDAPTANMDHISVLDEVLRMLLEIINSCLTHQLPNNLHLVYALLHKKQLFQSQLPITQNIEMVIGYFTSRLQRVQEGAGGDLSVAEVLQCIKKGAEQWSSDRLKKFPDLKFRYVEEERPEEFFSPYVWTLINNCGGVYWASEGGARVTGDLMIC